MAESQKDRCGHWGAFVSYRWDSLNKKKGFGVGLQVLLVTESAAGRLVPPYLHWYNFSPRMRNRVEEEGPKATQEAFCSAANCSVRSLVWF